MTQKLCRDGGILKKTNELKFKFKFRRIILKSKLLLFLFAAFICFGFCTNESFATVPIPKGVGVCVHSASTQELDMIKAAGFTIARTDLKWNQVESVKGQYSWAATDQLVNDYTSRGIRPYLILDYNNFNYGASNELSGISTSAQITGYTNFAKAAAERYKGKGIIWEIWNEPNLDVFWNPAPNSTAYMNLLKSAVPAMKAADPSAIVVAPGVAYMANIFAFLDECGQQGLYGLVDAVSVHPYQNANPENGGLDNLYDQIRNQIKKYNPGNPNLPIIGGEFGFSTSWSNIQNETTEAQYLVRQLAYHDAKNVPVSMIYDFRNDGTDPANVEHNFGLVKNDYSLKAAYNDVKTFNQTLAGMTYSGRIASAGSDYLYEYTNTSGAKTTIAWTTGAAHSVTIYGQSVNLTGTPVYIKNATTPPPPVVTIPASPSNIQVTSVTKGATTGNYFVNLSWTDNSNNETSFEVQQSVNSTTSFQTVATPAQNSTSNSVNIGATPTQGTYYYKILAVNTAGKSQPSNVATANVTTTTTPPPGVPVAPSGLQVTSQPYLASGTYWVNLSWVDNSNDETGFKVQQSINSTTNYQTVVNTAVNSTSISISIGPNPVAGTYYYKVTAENASGSSQPSNVVSADFGTVTPPPTPTATAPTNLTAKIGVKATTGTYSAILNWKDNATNETGYDIYQSALDSNNFKLINSISAFAATGSVTNTTTIGVLPALGTYYYKVVAKFADGTTQASNVVSTTVKEYVSTAPTNLKGLGANDTANKPNVVLSWTDKSVNEQGFNVYFANTQSGPFTKVGTADKATTMVVHPLANTGTYYYQITSFNSAGESAPTAIVTVVVN